MKGKITLSFLGAALSSTFKFTVGSTLGALFTSTLTSAFSSGCAFGSTFVLISTVVFCSGLSLDVLTTNPKFTGFFKVAASIALWIP